MHLRVKFPRDRRRSHFLILLGTVVIVLVVNGLVYISSSTTTVEPLGGEQQPDAYDTVYTGPSYYPNWLRDFASKHHVTMPASIPHSIYQVAYGPKSGSLVERAKDFITGWQTLNPGFNYTLLVDDESDDVVKTYFPQYLELWDSIPVTVVKTDLMRFLLLWGFGGIYGDLDAECLNPFEQWYSGFDMSKVRIIVGVEWDYAQFGDQYWKYRMRRGLQFETWAAASTPGHPIVAEMIHRVFAITRGMVTAYKIGEKPGIMDWAGPGVWADCVTDYLRYTVGVDVDKVFWGLTGAHLFGDVLVIAGGLTGHRTEYIEDGISVWRAEPDQFVQHHFFGSWKGDPNVT